VSSPLCDAGGAQPAARAGRSPGRPRGPGAHPAGHAAKPAWTSSFSSASPD